MAVTLSTLRDQGRDLFYLGWIPVHHMYYVTFWGSIIKVPPCGRKPPICGLVPAAVSQIEAQSGIFLSPS